MVPLSSSPDELPFAVCVNLKKIVMDDFVHSRAVWYKQIVPTQQGVSRNKSKCQENNRSYLETTQLTGKAKTPEPISN